MINKKSFASDNHSGIHPTILEAIGVANIDHAPAYGDDKYTQAGISKLKEHFGENIDAFFVFNGTGANVLGLQAVTTSYQSILCAHTAHINEDECGAFEKSTGSKLILLPTYEGKISVEDIKKSLHSVGNPHRSQPKVVSISQTTELGTVYTPDEIKAIADVAHENGLLLHMDGARLSNAAASLGTSLKEITADVGVDILSFGGTKNGLMIGEAVIFFNKEHAVTFPFVRKQGMQLGSKMRFIGAQFEAYLSDNLWYDNAKHSNDMTRLLANELEKISEITFVEKVESNAIFISIPEQYLTKIQENYYVAVWSKALSQVRLMASFDTTEEDIHQFVALVKKVISDN
ncbi:threonine aldolase family protein [Bacillus solimangrovi]|uniref:Threonine aldolase n=1 Tax=Bacillus solimangrovi TaxID=1305675 RepID=A0A1E5LBV3_9BACI|nr:low specificity L-threonine aldolase [Bacillus solimangrovi]OEH91564.1 threonine aldolase [Bacillus solimangrovi]